MGLIYSKTYSGYDPVSTTFTATTITALVDNIKAALVSAGWSVYSGSSGNWVLDSGPNHPNGFSLRIRLYNPGSGSTARIYTILPYDSSSTLHLFLLPGSDTFRVMAGAYWFVVYSTGSDAARKIAEVFIPYLPSQIQGSPPAYTSIACLHGNAASDIDTTADPVLRTSLHNAQTGLNIVNGAAYYTINIGSAHILMLATATGVAWRWLGDVYYMHAPMLGMICPGGTSQIVGYLFDAFSVRAGVSRDVLWSFDGHTFRCYSSTTEEGQYGLFLLESW